VPNLMEKALTPEQRAKIPKGDFIFPDRDPPAYPIHDAKHALDALTFARWPQNKKDFKTVLAAVKKRYPKVVATFKGGKYESVHMSDHPVLRERLESIRAIIAEADDLAACDPNSITGMFMQEMCGKKHGKKSQKKSKS
jgi:hypothetical protein